MSPTLDDVSVILGIPVIGKSISCKKLSNVDIANLLVEALGVTIDEANVALKAARGQSIKASIRVLVVYLSFLMDLRSVASYAWGAAALAFLYWQLGTATKYAMKQLTGYMTLLEAWIYKHFVGAGPHPNLDYKEDQPRVFHWISRTQSSS
ncbi:protein MAINTENANCE OF MERISTEMS-like [Camellia sinensis]|uniref:protein MAINTENANCE OF MERISTEMS-like n=1 Tax=Camellia sinensis TaxID=4442 RepID=UPI0010365492|nr:protein MAINTENANCE OF MERISTEMS-like [Camellia sinensis]